mgnify:CR=1 FL=1
MVAFPDIPQALLPTDGRFGCGPSKVRAAQIEALSSPLLMGTSHRAAPVRGVVASLKDGLRSLLSVPDDYEVVLGNGGASAFWDVACACLISSRAAFGSWGAFGAKFASEAAHAPHLTTPLIDEATPGSLITVSPRGTSEGIDVYAYPHNETSTGVTSPIYRVEAPDTLTLVDGTSIVGAAPVDLTQIDAYYFSLQKALGSDGGLWVAFLSPAAIERARRIEEGSDGRWVPQFLSLTAAVQNSRKDQTLNTPALATIIMAQAQVRWLLERGGMGMASTHCAQASSLIYQWAEANLAARPFVENPAWRSPVTATIEIDEAASASELAAHLRARGIVDIGAYRGVGANQLRIGTWPSVEIEDVEALLACIDYCLERVL